MGSGPVRPADEHARDLGGQQVRVGEMGGFQGEGGEGGSTYTVYFQGFRYSQKMSSTYLLSGREKQMKKNLNNNYCEKMILKDGEKCFVNPSNYYLDPQ